MDYIRHLIVFNILALQEIDYIYKVTKLHHFKKDICDLYVVLENITFVLLEFLERY